MKLSIVLPAHDEEQSLPALLRRLRAVLDSLDGWSWEVVAVDDGSNDDTWAYIREVARQDARIRGLRMSRNFGHQIALSAGMAAAEGDAVITMDSDLQHPPALIPALLERE